MGVGDLDVWWRNIRTRTVEINREGGDRPSVRTIWTVEINMDGGDKLSIWTIWTVEINMEGGDNR